MKKIDTHTWKSVPLTDLFEPVLSEGDNKANRLEDGDIPLISSGSFNNGIAKMVKEGDGVSKMFAGNVLTIDMFGKAFYQPNPFLTVSHGRVNILLPKFEMTPAIGLFFATLLNREYRDKYSFTTMCNQNQLQNESLIIPWKDNQPDFAYMEQYIRSLEQRVQTTLTTFEHLIHLPKHAVDTTQWRAYKIGDLFDVVKGKRLTKTNMKEGVINYIGATAFNNGITAKIANDDNLHQAGTITVCYNGSIGQAFYQNEPYWATDDVNVLYPRFEMSKYVALFIIPILKALGQKYGYVDKWTQDKMKETEMPLPTNPNGTPDFAYMEQYMQKIERRVQQNLNKIA